MRLSIYLTSKNRLEVCENLVHNLIVVSDGYLQLRFNHQVRQVFCTVWLGASVASDRGHGCFGARIVSSRMATATTLNYY